jgi:uncharacterized protein (DUF58 family)
VLWLLLEWYGAASEVSWLFLLASWIAAVIVVAAGYALWNRGLRLRLAIARAWPAVDSPVRDLPESVLRQAPRSGPIFEGDSFEVVVRLETAGAARGPAFVSGDVSGLRVAFGTAIVPRRGWQRSRSIHALRRSPIGAAGWTVRTGDPLGFFRGSLAVADTEVGLVLPRFVSLAGRRQTRELEAATAAHRAGAGTELFGVREFRPGDSLRRIHWRTTARRGELVVREYEPPGMQTLALLVDPSPRTRRVADQVARIAASEAWDCIREGGRVVLWGPGLLSTEPAHGRDLWALLEWLARYPGAPGDDAAPAATETVMVTGFADERLVEAVEAARRQGSRARAWVVGDAELDVDVPVERAGLEWPL